MHITHSCFDEDDFGRYLKTAKALALDAASAGETQQLCPFCTLTVLMGAASIIGRYPDDDTGDPITTRERFLRVAAFTWDLFADFEKAGAVQ